jgi:PIN domain nuclease of toxin-antitoxin system
MRLLLDTHALIWFLNGDKQLPEKSIALIRDIKNRCHISIASIWEIAIKLSLGKMELNKGFDDISKIMRDFEIELLPISFEHINELLTLEFHHRDPFDRIIISQGIVEGFHIVTKDEYFKKYDVKIIWD